ncbi:MAG: formate dehydrogenase accessory sulfurtransferase FdhD [Leptolyngbya sp.]|nr:formate dehydrogenase accessory sulfurtransferase FdhD [Candidatus Melainabacteria bacterium]
MNSGDSGQNIVLVETQRVRGDSTEIFTDSLSVEEPLEIQIEVRIDGIRVKRSVAVTMRTPGNDSELATGFLFTEGIITKQSDIGIITAEKNNIVKVVLNDDVIVDFKSLDRHSFVASSCGVCGKKTIEAVMERCEYKVPTDTLTIASDVISSLPGMLRSWQEDFDATGGVHASALFNSDGLLIDLREDVGRHNALDKLLGSQLLHDNLPLSQRILLLSGRASFELVQKAAHAGITIVAAVGAPSSLAVELAKNTGITLLGFVRDGRFNIYSGSERIKVSQPAL